MALVVKDHHPGKLLSAGSSKRFCVTSAIAFSNRFQWTDCDGGIRVETLLDPVRPEGLLGRNSCILCWTPPSLGVRSEPADLEFDVREKADQFPVLEDSFTGYRQWSGGFANVTWRESYGDGALSPVHESLFSPSTGIVDSHDSMLALQTDAEAMGMTLALNSNVTRGGVTADGIELVVAETSSGLPSETEQMILSAKLVVNAAVLHAQSVARRMDGLPPDFIHKGYYARGCYFYPSSFSKPPFSHLIYPVPEDGGSGVHVTMHLGEQTRFDYYIDPGRGDKFYSEVRKYFPALPDGVLQPG
ncbi:hypothetical protein R1flu_028022 [Riccia fluitans]|uniref:L-2-hydroxyglutarate dehydrogenase, mitochondrial n=1 Tax=Riccia fluitans TaxID=41844 RepID=A0ABD1XKZ4_9MARC